MSRTPHRVVSAALLLRVFATVGFIQLGFMPLGWGAELTGSNPWIRAAPPNSNVLAGYVVLSNPARQSVTITGVSSADFDRVELHVTRIEKGMARMEQEAELVVAAGGEVRFEPTGRHLMLLAPKRKFTVGDSVVLHFAFSDGTQQKIAFTVRESDPILPAAEHDHSHGAPP